MTRPTDRRRAVDLTLGAVLALLAAATRLAPRPRPARRGVHLLGGVRPLEHTPAIGRANLDGTRRQPSFITGTGRPYAGIAVDAKHIYWANWSAPVRPIGRANLDGTGVDQSFITGTGHRRTVAVDARPHLLDERERRRDRPRQPRRHRRRPELHHRRSAHYASRRRGRRQPHLLDPDPSARRHDRDRPRQPRRHRRRPQLHQRPPARAARRRGRRRHIYWTNGGAPSAIGRANLDGTRRRPELHHHRRRPIGRRGRRQARLLGARASCPELHTHRPRQPRRHRRRSDLHRRRPRVRRSDLAVDALTDTRLAGKATAKRTQKQQDNKVRVEVKVKAKERLTAKATGKIKVNPTYKLKPKKVQVAAGKTKTLKLKPKKKAARKIAAALKRGEKAKAKLTVKLTDLAGNTRDREAAGEAEAMRGRTTDGPTLVPTRAAVLALLVRVVVLPLALAARADGYIYWAELQRPRPRSAAPTSTAPGVDQSFITFARPSPIGSRSTAPTSTG